MHVLFVCTGNICRSPIAERLAIARSTDLGLRDFTASSAGTHAVIAHPIHDHAARFIDERGGDYSNFSARQLTPKIAFGVDLVITMTKQHRDSVLEVAPHLLRRTFTLTQAATLARDLGARGVDDLSKLRAHLSGSDLPDIADPIGSDYDAFLAVGDQISELLVPLLTLGEGEVMDPYCSG